MSYHGISGGMPERYRQSYGRIGPRYYGFPLTYGQHIDYVSSPVMLGSYTYEGIFNQGLFGHRGPVPRVRAKRALGGSSGDGLGSVLAVL